MTEELKPLTKSEAADVVLKRIMSKLEGRKGFDWWWDKIDPETQEEIKTELVGVLTTALADAKAEGRREMREEAANIAKTMGVGETVVKTIQALPERKESQ